MNDFATTGLLFGRKMDSKDRHAIYSVANHAHRAIELLHRCSGWPTPHTCPHVMFVVVVVALVVAMVVVLVLVAIGVVGTVNTPSPVDAVPLNSGFS